MSAGTGQRVSLALSLPPRFGVAAAGGPPRSLSLWGHFILSHSPPDAPHLGHPRTVTAVITSSNAPGAAYSWSLDGGPSGATPLGSFDAHDRAFDSHAVSADSASAGGGAAPGGSGVPVYTLTLYPTSELRASYTSAGPAVACAVVAASVVIVSLVFAAYDWLLSRRARVTEAIVSHSFPASVRGHLFNHHVRAAARQRKLLLRAAGSAPPSARSLSALLGPPSQPLAARPPARRSRSSYFAAEAEQRVAICESQAREGGKEQEGGKRATRRPSPPPPPP